MIADAVFRIEREGGRPSKSALEKDDTLRNHLGGRNEIRDTVGQCIGQGWLTEHGTTSDRRLELTDSGRALSPATPAEATAR
jgi:hypothetical protein